MYFAQFCRVEIPVGKHLIMLIKNIIFQSVSDFKHASALRAKSFHIWTLKMSSHTNAVPSTKKPYTIIVEGNIGSGKTTFLEPFSKNHSDVVEVQAEHFFNKRCHFNLPQCFLRKETSHNNWKCAKT